MNLRVAPFMPLWIERLLLIVGGLWFVNLVNFMDGLDWMTVAEVVPITAALAIFGAFGYLPATPTIISLALVRRHDRLCLFQPAGRQAFPRRRRQPADRSVARLAAGRARRPRRPRGRDPVAALLSRRRDHHAHAPPDRNGEKVWHAHRSHFYQRATDRGFTVRQVVARVFAVNIALAALAFFTLAAPGLLNKAAALICGAAVVGWLLLAFARGRGAARRRPRHSGADQSEEPGMHHR